MSGAAMMDYERLLRRLHGLIAMGQGDGPEAEALADAMDGPWRLMTPCERRHMEWLSAELNRWHDRGGPISEGRIVSIPMTCAFCGTCLGWPKGYILLTYCIAYVGPRTPCNKAFCPSCSTEEQRRAMLCPDHYKAEGGHG